MKKTFAMMLALIMILATVIATVGTVSADEAAEGFMVATLNDITFDGELTITKGKNHENISQDTHEFKTIGTPHLAEYALDVTLENGTTIGAAYSIAKGELYLGVYATEEIYTIDITVGGAEYTVNATDGYVDGGEGLGLVAVSNSVYAYEIILPLSEIEIKKVDRGLGADLSITVEATYEDTFEGQLLFSKYAAGFTYNVLNKSASMLFHAQSTDNGDGTVTLVNDGTNARVYSIPNIPNLTKDLVIKFDINIESMPFSNLEDMATDAPGSWGGVKAPHIWFALKYRYTETLFMDIQNTADDGLVLNVFENVNQGFDAVKNQHSIVLGKETGEKFTLELEWSETGDDGKTPLNVYVDGKLVGALESSMNVDAGLGRVSGVLQFNAQWTKTDSSNDTITVTWGNISVNEISALYNEDAYNAMADGKFGDPEDPKDPEDPDEPKEPTDEGNNNAPETTDGDTDNSKDEEKKGCGSSVAGFGLIAVLGSALTAVVATKKKED